MSTPYLGEIRVVGFNFPPVNWATCNGQLLQISQYDALYSLLGTTYGGDGQNTFGVPDLRSRVAVASEGGAAGGGLSPYPLGSAGGTENVTLNANQLPAHGHPYAVPLASTNTAATIDNPNGRLPGLTSTSNSYAGAASGASLAANAVANGAVAAAGSSQPHTNISPVLALNYIICTAGLYPSRP